VNRFGTHVYADQHHCIATAGRCIITYSKQPPDAKYFAAWHATVDHLLQQAPGMFSVVNVIDSSAPPPSDAARQLIADAMQRHARSIDRFAHVVEGRGFGAAAIRSALSLLSLAARTPYRQKVFASVEDAGAWLVQAASEPSSGLEARALSSLVHTMRDKVAGLARAG
jgi:hypothetical protein